jgi:hypothetical protein
MSVGGIAINTPNYKSAAFPRFAEQHIFLNLASCSEHCISIKHRMLATFNINKKKNQF